MGNKNFQEKQASSRRTKEKPIKRKEKQFDPTKNGPITIEKAREIVYELIKQSRGFRDIAQIYFEIIGRDEPKRFSISEISKIKNSHEVKQSQKKFNVLDKQKAKIFEMLAENTDPRKIVVITKLTPSFVQKTTKEYLEMANYHPETIKALVNIAKEFNYNIQNTIQLKDLFWKALDYYAIYASMLYYCCRCGKPVYLTPDKNETWEEDIFDGLNYLSKNHWHPGCVV